MFFLVELFIDGFLITPSERSKLVRKGTYLDFARIVEYCSFWAFQFHATNCYSLLLANHGGATEVSNREAADRK